MHSEVHPWLTMARLVNNGRITPATRSELEAIVIGLASIRNCEEAQDAFDRLSTLPIRQYCGSPKLRLMSGEEVVNLIKKTLAETRVF